MDGRRNVGGVVSVPSVGERETAVSGEGGAVWEGGGGKCAGNDGLGRAIRKASWRGCGAKVEFGGGGFGAGSGGIGARGSSGFNLASEDVE
jgi:hypothetical protein